MRTKLALLVILIGLFFSRFNLLDQIPAAFVHDELIYVMQAKALSLTGSDVRGTWRPWQLVPFNVAFAELPAVLMTPAVALTQNPWLGARLTHALIGLLLPFALGWLVYGIWKNQHLAVITIALAAVNPWLWQNSRMTFDPLFNLFFYIVAGGVLLNLTGWKRLWAIPLLILGFFQYQGLKLVFLPWTATLVAWLLVNEGVRFFPAPNWRRKLSTLLVSLVVFGVAAGVMAWYVIVALPKQTAATRLTQLIFFDQDFIAREVNNKRRLSLDSPWVRLTENKVTAVGSHLTEYSFELINPKFLFFHAAEAANAFAVTQHGYFYALDLVFILAGIAFMTINKKAWLQNLMYGGAVIMATIPATLTTALSMTFRASLFYLLLLPVAAWGLYYLLKIMSPKLYWLVLAAYGVSVIYFSYHYFVQYPLYSADGQFFAERVLANYLHRLPPEIKVTVHTKEQEYLMNSYLFYNQLYTKDTAKEISQNYQDQTYQFGHLQLSSSCLDIYEPDPTQVLIGSKYIESCPFPDATPSAQVIDVTANKLFDPELEARSKRILSIPALDNNEDLYRIYHDPLCGQYQLPERLAPKTLNHLELEKLSTEEFCRTWLSTYKLPAPEIPSSTP